MRNTDCSCARTLHPLCKIHFFDATPPSGISKASCLAPLRVVRTRLLLARRMVAMLCTKPQNNRGEKQAISLRRSQQQRSLPFFNDWMNKSCFCSLLCSEGGLSQRAADFRRLAISAPMSAATQHRQHRLAMPRASSASAFLILRESQPFTVR
jgi:hypothetical protein